MRWALVLWLALIGTASMAETVLRPQIRPEPTAALRPLARPPGTPDVAKALAPQVELAALSPQTLARQEARADALVQVPTVIAAAPEVLVGLWPSEPPQFRPEGDFGGDLAGPAAIPTAVLRPELRPILSAAPAAVSTLVAPVLIASAGPEMRPLARPGDLAPAVISDVMPTFDAALSVQPPPVLSVFAIPVALRPQDRPADIVQRAVAVRVERVRGSVCGNPQIQGQELGHVAGPGACGIDQAVLVRSVDGVRLSTAGTMDCATAGALQDWVQHVAAPTLADTGGGLVGLQIMGTYACRNRNGSAAGRLSEHGHGKAIDIGGFNMADGSTITVLNGWGTRSYGALLRRLHDGACGIFGTILGPEANAYHHNHFHFDTASYRSGSYCQ